jgi:hypothetical protein
VVEYLKVFGQVGFFRAKLELTEKETKDLAEYLKSLQANFLEVAR